VFLRQQLDSKDEDASLRELLVDSLILYGLEGTDPDKGILRTRAEIVEQIRKVIKFLSITKCKLQSLITYCS
jgi:hypothetical protein